MMNSISRDVVVSDAVLRPVTVEAFVEDWNTVKLSLLAGVSDSHYGPLQNIKLRKGTLDSVVLTLSNPHTLKVVKEQYLDRLKELWQSVRPELLDVLVVARTATSPQDVLVITGELPVLASALVEPPAEVVVVDAKAPPLESEHVAEPPPRVLGILEEVSTPEETSLEDVVLTEELTARAKAVVTIEYCKMAASRHYGLTVHDIASNRRNRKIVFPRQVAMYLAVLMAPTRAKGSYPRIGRQFGNRDHTTVLHAVRKVTLRMEAEPELRAIVENLKVMVLRIAARHLLYLDKFAAEPAAIDH